jgi:pilus assembly protein CpaB
MRANGFGVMKTARIVVLGVALVAGGAAALLVNRAPRPEPVRQSVAGTSVELTKVLVAAGDIAIGGAVTANDLRWQDWPKGAASTFITMDAAPTAIDDWSGSVARSSFVAGEPIKPQKLIKGTTSGFLSAILPAGMRAVATKIAVDTAAGGFILPNDRVDVLLSRSDTETARQTGAEAWSAETILRNVRILAIDQTIEDQNGQKVIAGSTATLELNPRQSEVLALAKEMGTISLTLRSLADSAPSNLAGASAEGGEDMNNNTPSGLAVVRYGVTTTVVNR